MEQFPLPFSLLGWFLLALAALLIAVTGLSFRPIVNFIRSRIKESLFERLRKWAHTYVAALMQDPTLKGLASEEKKQQAVIWLRIRADKLGIEVTEQELSQLVEEAVYLVKNVALPALEDVLEKTAVPLIFPEG